MSRIYNFILFGEQLIAISKRKENSCTLLTCEQTTIGAWSLSESYRGTKIEVFYLGLVRPKEPD